MENGERANEENPFGCLGGRIADGTQHSTVIGGLLLASLLASALLCDSPTPARAPTPDRPSGMVFSRGDLLMRFNADQDWKRIAS